MINLLLAALLLLLTITIAHAAADELPPLLFGVRMVGIYPKAGIDNRLGNGVNSISSDWEPELTLEYNLARAVSIEYSLLFSQHSFSYGTGLQKETGATNLLTQGLTAKLHFNPGSTIDPYVGGGLNYLLPYDTHSTAPGTSIDSHLGWTIQGGIELRVTNSIWLNADYRYMNMATASRVGDIHYRFDISPHLIAFGLKNSL